MEKGSRAEKAGLRAGDVIVKVNGEVIHDAGDFTHALRSRKEATANIAIIRDKKEQTVTLTLPERKQSELFGESLEIPEINAETQEELSDLRSEMARLKPQMEEAVNRELERVKPDIELAKREALRQKEEVRKQMRELQRELRKYQQEMKRELKQEPHDGSTRI